MSSYIWPENYDFAETRAMHAPTPSIVVDVGSGETTGEEKKTTNPDEVDSEKATPSESATTSVNIRTSSVLTPLRSFANVSCSKAEPIDFEGLTKDFNFAVKFSVGMALLLIILVSRRRTASLDGELC